MKGSTETRLVTFATPRFRLRQILLGVSACKHANAVSAEHWTPSRLHNSGYREACPEISLKERGAGFWAWKPYVILESLKKSRDGELILYCDVGRLYPWKLIDRDLSPLLSWMEENSQDVFPGIEIPWHGSLGKWTKRDAFVRTGSDTEDYHNATTVQASFSIWRKTQSTLDLAEEWLEMCGRRELVSDDASTCGLPELPGFAEHRHDQSLWSILCKRERMKTLSIGTVQPDFDEKNPARIATFLDGKAPSGGSFLRRIASMGAGVEKLIR